jgi:hypothetical protein
VIGAIAFGIVMPVLPQLLLHMPNVAAPTQVAGFSASILERFHLPDPHPSLGEKPE